MPKLKRSEAEERSCQIRAVIAAGKERRAADNKMIAMAIGKTEKTVRNKLHYPETFTLGELRVIAKLLKLSEEEMLTIIGG